MYITVFPNDQISASNSFQPGPLLDIDHTLASPLSICVPLGVILPLPLSIGLIIRTVRVALMLACVYPINMELTEQIPHTL